MSLSFQAVSALAVAAHDSQAKAATSPPARRTTTAKADIVVAPEAR